MKALGIILAGGNSRKMHELTDNRAVAAMPIAGSYRSIDFALSNMSASHIQNVAVIVQYNSVSLSRHLSSSKWWDFGRKQGGLILITPTTTPTRTDWYRGTADSLYQNLWFLKESHEPYVVITSGDCIYKLDYNKVINYHVEKNADITVVCKSVDQDEDLTRFGHVSIGDDGRILDFVEKPVETEDKNISCGIYVLRRRLLIELLEQAAAEDRYDFVNDIIVRYLKHKRVFAYRHEYFWSNIATKESYYKTNMQFLDRPTRLYFFDEYPEIKSRADDLPPAKYNPGSRVKNSLVSGGCIINGTVENSLLFKNVFVGNNATIRNSIILDDVYIGDGAVIDNCIVDGHGTIKVGSSHIGSPSDIKIVIEKESRYTL